MATISVLIPAYNCEATIRSTLDSVLRQTVAPNEILVMNDGSTDGTAAVLESYKDRVKVLAQPNGGVASVRNALAAHATGDILAFLDSDDLWHPKYLEVQRRLVSEHPEAIASWVSHINFHGDGEYRWEDDPSDPSTNVELIDALAFFRRYNKATGQFSCLSYCCLLRKKLIEFGDEPFKVSGVEDSYFFSLLALVGPVIYTATPLVAYRVRKDSLSHDHSRTFGDWVHVFEILEEKYRVAASVDLWRAFRVAFASRRRSYAKLLMGAGRSRDARGQLVKSVADSASPISVAKSLALLLLTFMPSVMQPTWPSKYRG